MRVFIAFGCYAAKLYSATKSKPADVAENGHRFFSSVQIMQRNQSAKQFSGDEERETGCYQSVPERAGSGKRRDHKANETEHE